MKKLILITFCLLFSLVVSAQHDAVSTTAHIQTCIGKTDCLMVNNTAYVFYDETKNQLILKIEFSQFLTGKDSVDQWIDDLTGSNFYFIADLNKDDFLRMTDNSARTFNLNGFIFFNNEWESTSTELTIFTSSENSLLTQKTTDVNAYENFKVTFGISFLPKDFKLHKGPHQLKKIVTVGIAAGRLNQLKPEMRHLISDLKERDE